ncbi:hypothetical protein jhhlp_008167 [Lomentospora prolificans]|uniref:Zn(2)-C6 fungal-type domain-containing protein n=1 Tax=Lomentospora prolificans TaxID=41688 RepID=A0A2N3MZP0_9PEZI|nr:hypothetical protein jhhlp_008167 [Lomentospora prolificans]
MVGTDDHDRGGRPAFDAAESAPSLALSCLACRARKLKCDRAKPSCSRCAKLRDSCEYPSSRRRNVGARKTVKDLEDRIAQLESQAGAPSQVIIPDSNGPMAGFRNLAPAPHGESRTNDSTPPAQHPELSGSGDLIRLGLFEQLPPPQLMQELIDIYFDKMHSAAPMLHRARFTASLHLPHPIRPPVCLQYIVMAIAAATTEAYAHMAMPFYRRARAYAEADEVKCHGECFTTVPHAQCWCLIANFEGQQTMFSLASVSLARSLRIAQMLELHRLDYESRLLPLPLPGPRNWSELEERRRTWWVIFCSDRFVSATTGWPTLISENDIHTLLPASEDAFSSGVEERQPPLRSAFHQDWATCSSFAGRVLAAQIFHRTLEHSFERFDDSGRRDRSFGTFWDQHKVIDDDLTLLLAFLPSDLRLPENYKSQNAVFVNMMLHSAVICLHKAALGYDGQPPPHERFISQSQDRLLPAAEEILEAFRIMINVHEVLRNPLMSFAAYMAGTVFLDHFAMTQAYTSERNLDFLLRIMVGAGKNNPVARSMIVQLGTDMRHHGLNLPIMEQARLRSPAFAVACHI